MRRLILAIFALSLLATGQQGFAKELTFKFDIYSSGPMMYACNAGIKHAYSNQKVCHIVGSHKECKIGDHNCVCTGTNGGNYLMDFMRFKKQTWETSWGKWMGTKIGAVKAGQNEFNTIVDDHSQFSNPFYTKLDQVTFNLGSEQYGAEFFVDVCFRASQIDYFFDNPNLNVTSANSAYAQITVTDVSDLGPGSPVGPGGVSGTSETYLALSGLKSKATLVCDLQGEGKYRFAHNGNSAYSGQYDTLVNEIKYKPNGEPLDGEYKHYGPVVVATANTQTLFNTWINTQNHRWHPRFCAVRYSFKETTMKERRWQRHDARVITKTSIEEAAE